MYLPTIESLNAFNVIFSQRVARGVRVDGVHQGTRVCGVGHTEGMAQLMGCHYKQVVSCREKMFSQSIVQISSNDYTAIW